MKKLIGFIFSFLTFALMSSCDGNKKLEQADAEYTIKEFVQTNAFGGDGSGGQFGFFDANSITSIEPIIQFTEIEANLVVHFNYHDSFADGNMCLKFNFKKNIDKKWILTSVDAISGIGSQDMSNRLQKWQNVNRLVQKGNKYKEKKSSIASGIRFFLQKKVKDSDGNVYKTIKIGTQVWMAENLKTTKFNDGTPIPLVSGDIEWSNLKSPGYCFYNNDAANKKTYGALYNWYTVNTKKLAPTGWHVPTEAEWTTLINYLIINDYGYGGGGSDISKSMASIFGWDSDTDVGNVGNDQESNNSSGFAGLPGGVRSSEGPFNFIGGDAYWWSYSEDNTNTWGLDLGDSSSDIFSSNYNKQCGLSVRCVQD